MQVSGLRGPRGRPPAPVRAEPAEARPWPARASPALSARPGPAFRVGVGRAASSAPQPATPRESRASEGAGRPGRRWSLGAPPELRASWPCVRRGGACAQGGAPYVGRGGAVRGAGRGLRGAGRAVRGAGPCARTPPEACGRARPRGIPGRARGGWGLGPSSADRVLGDGERGLGGPAGGLSLLGVRRSSRPAGRPQCPRGLQLCARCPASASPRGAEPACRCPPPLRRAARAGGNRGRPLPEPLLAEPHPPSRPPAGAGPAGAPPPSVGGGAGGRLRRSCRSHRPGCLGRAGRV